MPIMLPEVDVRCGDFTKVLASLPSDSVSLIVTDPPYAWSDLYLYGEVAKFAARVLKRGGLLAAYSGNLYLPKVYDLLGQALRYVWTFALTYPEGHYLPCNKYAMRGRWKPILLFGKPPINKTEPTEDKIEGAGPEKDLDPWQQAEAEAAWLVERLSRPGELVCDPMIGTGTTGAAAMKLRRPFVGADIDGMKVETATQRLEDVGREILVAWKQKRSQRG
jgi:hypothetical protein